MKVKYSLYTNTEINKMKTNETNEINTVNCSLYTREHLHFASLVYHIALVAFMYSFEETFLLNFTKTLDLRTNS